MQKISQTLGLIISGLALSSPLAASPLRVADLQDRCGCTMRLVCNEDGDPSPDSARCHCVPLDARLGSGERTPDRGEHDGDLSVRWLGAKRPIGWTPKNSVRS